ncbi:MAG: triose-phosphate isomerase [Schleiferiaceae bacterium]
MRQKIVAGNWKMNKTVAEGADMVREISDAIESEGLDLTTVIVAPPSLALESVVTELWDDEAIAVAAQNCHQADSGAFTGEISAPMLADLDVDAVILGHSERRQYFGETNEILAQKVDSVLKNELVAIFCVGEVLEERKSGKHQEVVASQLKEALFHLSADDFENIVIAYEPVWAIGTGETATPEQAQEMHAYIRSVVEEAYDAETAQGVSILYGGSCKPSNANDLFSQPDVDGGLIGGASLIADDFIELIRIMEKYAE